jgi:hypothetical protein
MRWLRQMVRLVCVVATSSGFASTAMADTVNDQLKSFLDKVSDCTKAPKPILVVIGVDPNQMVLSEEQSKELRLTIEGRLDATGRGQNAAGPHIDRLRQSMSGLPQAKAEEQIKNAFGGNAFIFFEGVHRSGETVSMVLTAITRDAGCTKSSDRIEITFRQNNAARNIDAVMSQVVRELAEAREPVEAIDSCPFDASAENRACAARLSDRLTAALRGEARERNKSLGRRLAVHLPAACKPDEERVQARGNFEHDLDGFSRISVRITKGSEVLAWAAPVHVDISALGCKPVPPSPPVVASPPAPAAPVATQDSPKQQVLDAIRRDEENWHRYSAPSQWPNYLKSCEAGGPCRYRAQAQAPAAPATAGASNPSVAAASIAAVTRPVGKPNAPYPASAARAALASVPPPEEQPNEDKNVAALQHEAISALCESVKVPRRPTFGSSMLMLGDAEDVKRDEIVKTKGRLSFREALAYHANEDLKPSYKPDDLEPEPESEELMPAVEKTFRVLSRKKSFCEYGSVTKSVEYLIETDGDARRKASGITYRNAMLTPHISKVPSYFKLGCASPKSGQGPFVATIFEGLRADTQVAVSELRASGDDRNISVYFSRDGYIAWYRRRINETVRRDDRGRPLMFCKEWLTISTR